ncbi:hypothetical protein JCM13210_06730 [Thermaerobacter litoralis]
MGFPWAALVAAATGILSGLSIGGGSVLVPALVLLLNVPQPVAQGVVLATFPAVALVAAWIHWRHGFLRWRLALRVTAGSAAGAWLGAQLGTSAPEELLRRLFGVYLVLIGSYALYRSRRARPGLAAPAQQGQQFQEDRGESGRGERSHGDALEERHAHQRAEDQPDDDVGVLLQQHDAPGAQDRRDEARHEPGVAGQATADEGLDGLLEGDLAVGEGDEHRHDEQDQPQGHGVLLEGGEQRRKAQEPQQQEDPRRGRDQRVATQGTQAKDG